MLDVSRWLADQGLGHHAQAFADSGIADDILPDLTDADLKELGLNLGDRRRLLKAIAALDAGPTQDRAQAAVSGATPPTPRQAERRQLTVMFVDMVGSTALSARLDPEEMREVIRAYQHAVAGEIARLEGHVARLMGDGVLTYFGWPRAHEDGAERAVRAGLAVARAVGQLMTPTGEPLVARVGIATGLVVVGHLIGEGATREDVVIGETPNLAARLQQLAPPGRVVVAETTRRLLGHLFFLEDLGTRALTGFAEPVRAWAVCRPRLIEGRFEAHRVAGLTPLVGRERELALLFDRWRRARAGHGQLVLLAGEPGVGKSRLVRTLRERLSGEQHQALRYQCSPYHVGSALHPVIAALERGAHFSWEDDDSTKLDKLQAMLSDSAEDMAAVVPLIAALLSVPTGARYPPLDITPQRQKDDTLHALLAQLEAFATRQPVLAILEDAHWIDPTTAELFGRAIDRVRNLPVLIVITFRPEFEPPWSSRRHMTLLTLNRLRRQQTVAMIEQVTRGKRLPAEVVEQIAARTDGVPLFLEELTKTVLEAGFLEEREDRYELSGPLPPLAIPSSLQDSLLARLDRLSPVKEVAQVAACLGREFPHELLAAVATPAKEDLRHALERLVGSELVFRRGPPTRATYVFKHALVQEAAYQSLLKSKRQQLHARIATVLEERFQRVAESEPELLAHHYTQAGLLEPAISNWRKAGYHAIRRSANLEAVSHLRTALKLLRALPETRERDQLELIIHIEMGGPMIAVRGYSDPKCFDLFSNARRIGERLGDSRKLLPALFGQWVYEYVSGRLPTAMGMAGDFMEEAQRTEDPGLRLLGHQSLGLTLLAHGQPARALPNLRHAIEGFDPSRHARVAYTYGQNPRIACLAYTGLALGCQGYADQALRIVSEAIEEATAISHFNTLAAALYHGGVLCLLLRDFAALGAMANRLYGLAEEHAAAAWAANGRMMLGCVRSASEAGEESLAQLHLGIAAVRAFGWHLFLPSFEVIEASGYGRLGDSRRGLRLLANALVGMEGTDQRLAEAEYHRVRASLSCIEANSGDAEAALARAIDIAQHQNARTFEVRAATDLARLRRDQGRRVQAYHLLAPIYDWFTEGFDTADLKEAKALLEELA